MKKVIKFSLIGLGVIFIFIGSVFTYVYINREKILKNITEELNAKYDATFLVKDLRTTFFSDFPHFSLTLINTEIRGSRFDIYHIPLLKAEKIFLRSNILEFFRGNIKVSSLKIADASITIFKTKDGYTNNVFKLKDGVKKEKSSSSGVDFSIQELMFNDVKFLVTDSIKTNSFDFMVLDLESTLKEDDDLVTIKTKGDIYFEGLTFKEEKGAFIRQQKLSIDWHCLYDPETKVVKIEPNSLLIHDKSKFFLSGNLRIGEDPDLELIIKNNLLTYKHATELLNPKISDVLSKYEYEGTMDTEILLKAKLDTSGSQPQVEIKAKAEGITIHWKEIEATKVKFNAVFNNHFDPLLEARDSNTRISFNDFDGLVEGLPVKGNFYAHDLKNTRLNADFLSEFKLVNAQHLVNSSTMLLKGGDATINLHYNGPVKDLIDANTRRVKASVKGSVNISNGEIRYVKKPYSFKGINVSAFFDSSDILLKAVNLVLNDTKINANGNISQFIPFLIDPTQKIIAKINIGCPYINLASFIREKPANEVAETEPEYKGPGYTPKKRR